MNAEAKCYCASCGGGIEFPVGTPSHQINCPHCGVKIFIGDAPPVVAPSSVADSKPRHSIFYYVFCGTLCLFATLFILGVGCFVVGVGVPAFLSGTNRAIANTNDAARINRRNIEEEAEKDRSNYISNSIELYEFSASYHDTRIDGRIPGVDFKIKNNGSRTIKRLGVTVYFKDPNDHVISEETYLPISSGVFDNNAPLKPGYIWQLERNKFYPATHVPSEWQEGNASIEITTIEFE